MTFRRSIAFIVCVASTVAFANSAFADDDCSENPSVTVRTVDGHRVYDLGRRCVQGEQQRPYQFTVQGRGPLDYQRADVSRDFVQGVVQAVRRSPF